LANRRKKTNTILEKHLHIICFNVPYPVDYGGVVDLFWKLPYLQKLGVKIHLHCFDYGRGEQPILNKYCVEVNYYHRSKSLLHLLSNLPFIVATRSSETLKLKLLEDDYPILCEGLHTSSIFLDKRFVNRKIVVRLHNVEHEYYQYLKATTSNLFKKAFYWRESMLLKNYESLLGKSSVQLLALSESDVIKFKEFFNAQQIQYLPMFIPETWKINSKNGLGKYGLYQGDLSVSANEKSVIWLIQNVFKFLNDYSFIIAGKSPSNEIKRHVQKFRNITLISNPTHVELDELIQNAQLNILPSFSSSGIKLKLLNALFNGRFCLVNHDTVSGSGLDELCILANDSEEFIAAINEYMKKDFISNEIEKRKVVLTKKFNNLRTAELLTENIYN